MFRVTTRTVLFDHMVALKLPHFRGRLAGRDQSFSAMTLASYAMGHR